MNSITLLFWLYKSAHLLQIDEFDLALFDLNLNAAIPARVFDHIQEAFDLALLLGRERAIGEIHGGGFAHFP